MDRQLTADELLAALRASEDYAFVAEHESGWFVIDGRFNLAAAAAKLSERQETQRGGGG